MAERFNDRDIPLFLWILLAVVIVITMVLTIPKIMEYTARYESMMEPAVRQNPPARPQYQRALVRTTGALTAELTGHLLDPAPDAFTLYDRLITALLKHPTLAELSAGYITLIPEDTRYIGSQVIRRTLYIELSEEFFTPHALGEAAQRAMQDQLTLTLSQANAIDQVLLIHNGAAVGEPVTLPR